jgi:hypothetical protein
VNKKSYRFSTSRKTAFSNWSWDALGDAIRVAGTPRVTTVNT